MGVNWICFVCCFLTQERQVVMEEIPVRTFLDSVIEQRSKPIAYEMEFRLRRNVFQGNNTNQERSGTLVETSGIMRVDQLAGVCFVESSTQLIQVIATTPDQEQAVKDKYSKLISPAMRLILPDREYVCNPTVGKIVERKRGEAEWFAAAPLFDFRIFGWAIEYDFDHGHTIDEVLRIQKKILKPELNFKVGKDNIATLDLGNEETRVDIDRGYWPIERKVWSSMNKERRYVKESVKVGLVKFEDEWLPKRIDWTTEGKKSDKGLGLDIKWISYNETIDPNKVSLAYMIRRLEENSEAKQKDEKK